MGVGSLLSGVPMLMLSPQEARTSLRSSEWPLGSVMLSSTPRTGYGVLERVPRQMWALQEFAAVVDVDVGGKLVRVDVPVEVLLEGVVAVCEVGVYVEQGDSVEVIPGAVVVDVTKVEVEQGVSVEAILGALVVVCGVGVYVEQGVSVEPILDTVIVDVIKVDIE